ncbi:hypothetical protein [Dactylosporangium sp. NPDC005555]|uniref:hypothetical protein n=1 Tax=Dactylosporangium sp. NPDC005555 TaxID=3154889 RepID=UPI0033A99B67
MAWLRRRKLAKSEAHRLLDGGSGDSPLAGLLRAAAGPARPGELAGERDAVAVFRHEQTARQEAAAGTGNAGRAGAGPPPRRRKRSGRRVVMVAAAITVVVLAGTGVTAGAGRLPAPLQRAAHDWIDQVPEPAGPEPTPERPARAGSPTPSGVHRPSQTPSVAHTSTSAADFKKQCKEWQKIRDDPDRKPMDPADLQALTAAAGGADRIESFCGLAPATPATSRSAQPGPPGQQSGGPGNNKSKKPNGH